ncbi:hypothetical protein DBR43_24760 [Pedobacter sp. KBW06]|uniref:DUF4397 domain-containing protein n=1 Tax=Pedobacter sp. KBW06 TaxID=2153359 RepID=UPI000F59F558|nr:DUF4397 domain-containing protein [Pedobacter sp. KBW06]RQO67728.1 hypothetical protein DBR43_24760 [Pedobacter sp. KBW06]
MKSKLLISAVLLLSTIIYSCDKTDIQTIDGPANGASVKFFNFAVNGPVVNYYANDIKVTSAVSTTGAESGTTGLAYAAVYPATNAYAILPGGTYDLKATRPSNAAADPKLVINKFSTTLAEGKNYSLYLCGFYNTVAKTSDAFMLEDILPAIDSSAAYVRLVHTSPNANPVNLIIQDRTSKAELTIATNLPYKSGGTFVKIPQGVYDLLLRYPNSNTNIYTRTEVSFTKSNTYTLTLRGDITVGGTTAANRTFIDNTANR